MRRHPRHSDSTVAARLQGPSRSVGLPSNTECPTVSYLPIQHYEIATRGSTPRSDVACPSQIRRYVAVEANILASVFKWLGYLTYLPYVPEHLLRPLDTTCEPSNSASWRPCDMSCIYPSCHCLQLSSYLLAHYTGLVALHELKPLPIQSSEMLLSLLRRHHPSIQTRYKIHGYSINTWRQYALNT